MPLKIHLRSCPRCGGDEFPEEDGQSWEMVCLQCGHRKPVALARGPRPLRPVPDLEPLSEERREVATAA